MNSPQRNTQEWQVLDRAHYLHPSTDHAALRQTGARVAMHAEGIHVWDSDGNRMIDGLSGLGNVNLGYGRTEIVQAVAAEMQDLSYCQSFFNTTHTAAVLLAQKLSQMLPGDLNHVFFQCSGSEANETAVRAVRRYWDLKGQPDKRLLIARELAYHGSTHMAASLTGILPMHGAGGDIPLPSVHRIRTAYQYRNGPDMTEEDFGLLAASWLEEKILELGPENVAAFVAEPAQSAGGAICPPMTYWPEIQRICRKYDVLLVLDEVVMGFGRTGQWFGADYYGIQPDLMQLGKAITSGYMPLSACVLSDRVADVLIDRGGEWAHGYTYSGHPASCAAALENIRILEAEGIVTRAGQTLAPYFAAKMESFADHPLIGDVRHVGLMGGLEIVRDKTTREAYPYEAKIGAFCSEEAGKRGLAFRANGDTMSLMPPLIITESQLDEVFDIAREALDATAKAFGVI
ncbi:aminotransferase [Pseudooceanicola nanhaiensis]|uniref:aminotransferase n=1 Tax=Pseudooceanicola nanhaiensis TaxID=375761 RepID=UPI001CD4C7FE|nr:aminotransferase [Pseudooceanicola nanhaiensis]MCA0919535.1 aminotransferase class III-fold pyridoxal phosphate-dependent enzyme [Pseudooceanicola nanhaiensis]